MLTIALLSAALLSASVEPYRPTDDAEVLALVERGADNALQALRALDPSDPQAAAAFARSALEQAERLQNPQRAHYALSALAPHARSPDRSLRVLRATALQRVHRFDEAMTELDDLIEAGDPPAQAYFLRAILLSLRAEYDAAVRDCGMMLGRADPLAVAACAAIPRTRSGGGAAAYEALSQMLSAPGTPPTELLDYALGVRAEIAWRLDRPDALDLLRTAARNGKPVHRLNHADALLATGDAEAAHAAVLDMPGDGAALRRARALVAFAPQSTELAELRRSLEAGIAARALRADDSHAREDAYYFLHVMDDAAKALPKAVSNWRQQKEPLDAELLLDAAIRTGQPEAAAPVVRWFTENRVADARLAVLVAAVSRNAAAP